MKPQIPNVIIAINIQIEFRLDSNEFVPNIINKIQF